MSQLRYIQGSLKGLERSENKDRNLIIQTEQYSLFVLFDGVSSVPNANLGIDIAVEYIQKKHEQYFSPQVFDLGGLMYEAHNRIIQSKIEKPLSTYCAVYVPPDRKNAYFSSMGDSRVYEISPQYINQLSKDDNLINNKNVVTRCLGMLELSREDFTTASFDTLEKRVLLCSDGFYSFLEEDRSKFHSILSMNYLNSMNKKLLKNINGANQDDASYILIA